jgi:hypothetical protein
MRRRRRRRKKGNRSSKRRKNEISEGNESSFIQLALLNDKNISA